MDGTCWDYRSRVHVSLNFAHPCQRFWHLRINLCSWICLFWFLVINFGITDGSKVRTKSDWLWWPWSVSSLCRCEGYCVTQEAWFDNDQKVRHRCGLSTTKCVSPAPSSNLAGWICHLPSVHPHWYCEDVQSPEVGYRVLYEIYPLPISASWRESSVTSGQRGRYAFLSVTVLFLLYVCIEGYKVTLLFLKIWSKFLILKLLGVLYIWDLWCPSWFLEHQSFKVSMFEWVPHVIHAEPSCSKEDVKHCWDNAITPLRQIQSTVVYCRWFFLLLPGHLFDQCSTSPTPGMIFWGYNL